MLKANVNSENLREKQVPKLYLKPFTNAVVNLNANNNLWKYHSYVFLKV